MKKVFLLSCLLLSAMLTFAQVTKKVAILEVVDREGRLSYSQKLLLRSNMARAVSNTTGYEAYDRSDVDVIMSEQDFQRTGMVSDVEIRKLGEMTGVSLILVTEGVLTGDGKIFVSAKILNIETGRVDMMDNLSMGLSTEAIQEGCTALAKRLFGITASSTAMERYNIERMGPNEYIYMGKYMDKKEYEMFLRNNCPKAYGQYRVGKQLINAGWGVFGGGMAAFAGGCVMLGFMRESNGMISEGIMGGGLALMTAGGLVAAVGGGTLLGIGYKKRNNAYKIYNNTCASSSATPLSFNLTAGQNGLGIAMQF